MSGFIDGLTGATAARAEAANNLARQQQGVDQARQLSSVAAETARTGLSRSNPKGRRLLADAGPAALPSTVA